MPTNETLAAYARLALQIGVNVQPGQRVAINAFVEHAAFARIAAAEAYSMGARHVDVYYSDQRVRRAHIQHAPANELGWSPPWLVKRLDDLGAERGALLSISGNPEPEIFADLDGGRVAKARMRELNEAGHRLTDGLCNWSIIALPNEGWAQLVFGEPDVEGLWEAVATAVRLDEPDPGAAWRAHLERLAGRAAALNQSRFDSLRYRGPGTDLTIGLLPESRWMSAGEFANGIAFVANMPTEEVFSTPDARRVDGTVAATYPLQLQGTVIRGLRLSFEGGRAVEAHADEGQDLIKAHIASDDGSARLGEVALVDRDSRVGRTGLVFFDTLFDENAASHIALGSSILQCVPDFEELTTEERHARGANFSSLHTDFMIGSPEVAVSGVTTEGDEVPILQDGDWVLG
jgi:aminopeptidase